MKYIACLLLISSAANATPWSFRSGLDSSSFGGIIVHDFAAKATVTGVQWDAEHIGYKDSEVAEAGAFFGKRDTDSHMIIGPSLGTPTGSIASVATKAHEFVDWPALSAISDYGQYVHAYFNFGWDGTNLSKSHAKPDFIGLGGVLKFGK